MASSVDVSRLGVSALLTAQRALATTGHNIANVNTEGYSRQRVEQATTPPLTLGGAVFGTGVQISAVRRLVDDLNTAQLRVQTSNHAQADTTLALAEQLGAVLASAEAGLSPALQGFFDALQAVADDPSSVLERQVLLSEANGLVQRFGQLDARLVALDGELDGRIRGGVEAINELAAGVAELNNRIARFEAGGRSPNDLLDQRDVLINRIAEQVSIRTVTQDDGAVNVFVGNGQALVVGGTASRLAAVTSPFDATRVEVVNDGGVNISSSLGGGELGAALAFRDGQFNEAGNALGRLATGLVESFNAQHRLGLDLGGVPGGDFFSVAAPQVAAAGSNAGTGVVSASIADVAGLTLSDYQLRFDGGNDYTLTRLTDGQSFAIDTGGASPFTTASIDGLSLSITAGAAVGDRFLLRPTAAAAGTVALALGTPQQVAAAAPVRAEAPLGNGGDLQVTALGVNALASLPLAGAPVGGTLTLSFDAALGQFNLLPDPLGEGPLVYDPSVDAPGRSYDLLGGSLGITLAGTPVDGDTVVLRDNAGAVGDNRNALALAGLQETLLLQNGSATLQESYAQLVTAVGTSTRAAQTATEAFGALLDQAIDARAELSGVNLDEEAADLLRYQQAYQAAARLVSVADDLFQSLLAAVGR